MTLKERLVSMQDQREALENLQNKHDREKSVMEEQLKKTQLLLEQVREHLRRLNILRDLM